MGLNFDHNFVNDKFNQLTYQNCSDYPFLLKQKFKIPKIFLMH